MPAAEFETAQTASVAVLKMKRAPVNALDLPFTEALTAELERLAADTSMRALVLTGDGGIFSAGLDLKLVPGYCPAKQKDMVRALNRLLIALYAFPVPTVAAINGPAIAGGLVIALACDRRICVKDGASLGLTEIRAGVPYPVTAMAIVKAELAPSVAREFVLTGQKYLPRQAHSFGILDELQSKETLLPWSIAVAQELGTLPRAMYGRIKRQLRHEALLRMQQAIDGDEPAFSEWLTSETTAAAVRILARSAES